MYDAKKTGEPCIPRTGLGLKGTDLLQPSVDEIVSSLTAYKALYAYSTG